MGHRPLPLLLGEEWELESGQVASAAGSPKVIKPKAKQPSPCELGCLLIVVSIRLSNPCRPCRPVALEEFFPFQESR
jgi:hypothetical protein